MMKRILIALLLAVFTVSVGYCQEKDAKKEPTIKQVKDGNFILYVSNQSRAFRLVDIKAYIDDMVAFDQKFSVGNQDNYIPFSFNLSAGSHTLKLQSVKGECELEKSFKTSGKNWAMIEFVYVPETEAEPVEGHLTFSIQDKPIEFENKKDK